MAGVKVRYLMHGTYQVGTSPENITTFNGEPGDEDEIPADAADAMSTLGLVEVLSKKRGKKDETPAESGPEADDQMQDEAAAE